MKLLVPGVSEARIYHSKFSNPKTETAPSQTVLTNSLTLGVEVSPLVTRALTPRGGASRPAWPKVMRVLAPADVTFTSNADNM